MVIARQEAGTDLTHVFCAGSAGRKAGSEDRSLHPPVSLGFIVGWRPFQSR